MAVTLNMGLVMNAWYDIKSIGSGVKDSYSKEDVAKNSIMIREIM